MNRRSPIPFPSVPQQQPARLFLAFVSAQIVIAVVTFVALRVGANATTVGFAYLIAVLAISIYAGLTIGLISSLVATGCFNFFFIPPVRTFTVADPANWVALFSFFIASLIASRLVVRARTQAANADARRNEIEALYSLSIDLFAATNRVGALGEAATRALSNVGATGGGLILFDGSPYAQRVISWRGPKEDEIEDLTAGAGRDRQTLEFPAASGRDVYLPLEIGGRVLGVLVARGSRATQRALESVAALVALAVERERFVEESSHLQALRESDALKTSLLRAVSHDLTTPLTAIALQVERLQRQLDRSDLSETVADLAEQTGRLRRRIENLLAMARLEAGNFVPRPEPTPPADLFRLVREHLPLVAQSRPIHVEVNDDCPDVLADPSLALEVLVNLVENAHRASPAGSPIELMAHRHPLDGERVRLEVLDRGHGVAERPMESDTARRGLGLEIARSFAAANGGQVTLANRPGGGAIARLDLPAALLPAVAEEA
jgi:two-component system, OmpR family, sensor histidine kinase KdpD